MRSPCPSHTQQASPGLPPWDMSSPRLPEPLGHASGRKGTVALLARPSPLRDGNVCSDPPAYALAPHSRGQGRNISKGGRGGETALTRATAPRSRDMTTTHTSTRPAASHAPWFSDVAQDKNKAQHSPLGPAAISCGEPARQSCAQAWHSDREPQAAAAGKRPQEAW